MMRLVGRILRRLRRGEHGQSLVEFALLIPVMLIFVVAVIDFGKALFTYQVITNAAREGARRAALADTEITDSVIRAAIIESLDPVVDEDQVQWETLTGDGDCPSTSSTDGYVLVCGTGWSGSPELDPDAMVRIQMDYQPILMGNFLHWTPGDYSIPLKTKMVYRNE